MERSSTIQCFELFNRWPNGYYRTDEQSVGDILDDRMLHIRNRLEQFGVALPEAQNLLLPLRINAQANVFLHAQDMEAL